MIITTLKLLFQGSNVGDPDTMSIVISKGSNDLQDFIQILRPPVHLHVKYITVEYRCTKDRIAGVEVLMDSDTLEVQRIFSKLWKCKENRRKEPIKKRVKLKLPSDLKYNYNYFNQEVNFAAGKIKLRAWILDKELWPFYEKEGSGFPRASAKVSYDTSILPPFSRPYVYVSVKCRKWSWDILRLITSRRIPTCPIEPGTFLTYCINPNARSCSNELPCLFSDNIITLTCMNSCLLHWMI